MSKKKAFITGATGQDGSYLVPLLIAADYDVHVLISPHQSDQSSFIDQLAEEKKITLHQGTLAELASVRSIMEAVCPDEVYNLAAQSSVSESFEHDVETWEINYYGVGRLVNEALRANSKARIYQASSSEMFGNAPAPQHEQTVFDPQSPYAKSKTLAHRDFIVHKRESEGAFTVSGILFNHESPRRGKQFVTRKITHTLAKIAAGEAKCLELGNLNAVRDWGHAEDYVRAMHLMLQQDTPEDYVIASGTARSVRDFVEIAAAHVDIPIMWEGEGESEIGRHKETGEVVVKVNPEFYRPVEVNFTQGDATKAKEQLGWQPQHSFDDLVTEMVEFDKQLIQEGK